MLGVEYPIMLAGMGIGIASSDLAAAVSNAGGLGILGMSRLTPEQLREQVKRTRELTKKPFGADLLAPTLTQQDAHAIEDLKAQIPKEYWDFIASIRKELDLPDVKAPDYGMTEDFQRSQLEAIIDEKIPYFSTGLGTPDWMINEIKANKIMYISLVGTVRQALMVKDKGADIIVAQGTDAGGHTGRIGTLSLVPQVVDAVSPIPVVAAGGIGDGRGLAAALSLGAVGVWMGTAFLATHEASTDGVRFGWLSQKASDYNKKRLVEASAADAVISKCFTGKTARMLKSKTIDLWDNSGLDTLPYQLQTIIAKDLDASFQEAERYDYMIALGGQVAGLIKEIKSAGDMVQEIVEQAAYILKKELPSQIEI